MNRTPLALKIGYVVPCNKPKVAQEFLLDFVDSKYDRGYRLRFGAAADKPEVWIQHNNMEAIEMALTALKNSGLASGKPIRMW